MRRLLSELSALAWTVGGIGLVLITMSGDTLKWGIWISAASLAMHVVGVFVDNDEEQE
jgi:hypothetical protein